jgi:hypothetical protein
MTAHSSHRSRQSSGEGRLPALPLRISWLRANDNDGVEDSSGETQLHELGDLFQ